MRCFSWTEVFAVLFLSQGALLHSLIEDFIWLREDLVFRGRDVGFFGDMKVIVNHAIELLGEKLVTREKLASHELMNKGEMELVLIKPNTNLPEVLELSYYSNVMLSVFLGDAIIGKNE